MLYSLARVAATVSSSSSPVVSSVSGFWIARLRTTMSSASGGVGADSDDSALVQFVASSLPTLALSLSAVADWNGAERAANAPNPSAGPLLGGAAVSATPTGSVVCDGSVGAAPAAVADTVVGAGVGPATGTGVDDTPRAEGGAATGTGVGVAASAGVGTTTGAGPDAAGAGVGATTGTDVRAGFSECAASGADASERSGATSLAVAATGAGMVAGASSEVVVVGAAFAVSCAFAVSACTTASCSSSSAF